MNFLKYDTETSEEQEKSQLFDKIYSILEQIKIYFLPHKDSEIITSIKKIEIVLSHIDNKLSDLNDMNEYKSSTSTIDIDIYDLIKINTLLQYKAFPNNVVFRASDLQSKTNVAKQDILKAYTFFVLNNIITNTEPIVNLIKTNSNKPIPGPTERFINNSIAEVYRDVIHYSKLIESKQAEKAEFLLSQLENKSNKPLGIAMADNSSIRYAFDNLAHEKYANKKSWKSSESLIAANQKLWIVEVIFKNEPYNATKIFEALYTLTSTIETFEGVKVTIGELSISSRRFELFIWIQDSVAGQFVKNVFNSFQKQSIKNGLIEDEENPISKSTGKVVSNNLTALLNKFPTEQKEIESKIKLTDAQTEKIKTETLDEESQKSKKEILNLEVEEKKIKNEILRQDLAAKKLENLRNYGKLLNESFIDFEDMEIEINELPFVKRTGGVLSIGASIDKIEEKQIDLKKESEEEDSK